MKIAIIGAGASGLMAAIAATRVGAEVTMYEINDRVGKKILATGNGKCNLSNVDMSSDYYYANDKGFIDASFAQFGLDDTITLFKGLGLLLTEKRGGLYPYSEQAASVLDALRLECESAGVKMLTNAVTDGISKLNAGKNAGKFEIISNGTKAYYDRLIVSTGGLAGAGLVAGKGIDGYGIAKCFGHTVTRLYPSLTGLRCLGDFWKGISGVRTEACITIYADNKIVNSEIGELQLTDYGISGIPVFQVSHSASILLGEGKAVKAVIDFLPELSDEELLTELTVRHLVLDKRTAEQFLNGFFNKKLSVLFAKKLGISPNDTMNSNDFKKLIKVVKNFEVTVAGTNDFKQAQVTAGGIPLSEISSSFESVKCNGLYFAGEILDVDGKCGGYNLQWAWTSGHIAGEAAAHA